MQCAFGLGQIGSYLGAVISLASRCPLVLLNDEFSSHFGHSHWDALERWAANRANVIIVPSAERIPHLAKELRLSDQRNTFVEFRNTPNVSHPLERRDWHALLGIPTGRRIFLNAGTLGDWAQVPEILSSIVHWPPDSVLLLHSRTPEQEGGYRQQLSHLHLPGRVFWTSAPLSAKLLNSLVAHCNGSFALYRNIGPNFLLTGTSSGKLMRSVMCGSPVIASSFRLLTICLARGHWGAGVSSLGNPCRYPGTHRETSEHTERNAFPLQRVKSCENRKAGKPSWSRYATRLTCADQRPTNRTRSTFPIQVLITLSVFGCKSSSAFAFMPELCCSKVERALPSRGTGA